MTEPTHARRPDLVEVTGAAGTGKSTLVRRLCDGDIARFQRAEFIHTRDPEHLAELLAAIPTMLPILARDVVRAPRLSWPDRKLIAYVTRWHRVLRRKPLYRARPVAFDQGPVYALVRLRAQRRAVGSTDAFARWWDASVDRWAGELSAVVWLDAPDDVLRERINRRSQAHTIKGLPEADVTEFLGRYRRLFAEVIALLERQGGPRILRFDTSIIDAEAIAREVAAVIDDPVATSTARSVGDADG